MKRLNMLFLVFGWASNVTGNPHASGDKIVGGSEITDIRQAPFMVAMMIVEPNCTVLPNKQVSCSGVRWRYHCAGSLISMGYVLTVCHCIARFQYTYYGRRPAIPLEIRPEDWRFIAGSRKLPPNLERTTQIRIPSYLKYHPECAQDYQIMTIYDIGIAKMSERYFINEFVMPANVDRRATRFCVGRCKYEKTVEMILRENPNCMIYGWGSTRKEVYFWQNDTTIVEGGAPDLSEILRKAEMTVITQKECWQKIDDWLPNHEIPERDLRLDEHLQLCIISKENRGFCVGDSGGPMMCSNLLVALISNSMECGTSLPQVVQKLSLFWDILYPPTKRDPSLPTNLNQSGAERIHFSHLISLIVLCHTVRLYGR